VASNKKRRTQHNSHIDELAAKHYGPISNLLKEFDAKKGEPELELGTLWRTRKKLVGYNDITYEQTILSFNSIFMLIDHIKTIERENNQDHIKLLYQGKVCYIINVDIHHDIKPEENDDDDDDDKKKKKGA
jgi:hypothetical protein